jgi:hypothetical protein
MAQGGKTEEQAFRDAQAYVRAMRSFGIEGIESAIDALEGLMLGPPDRTLTETEMSEVLSYVDRLAMLSMAFGFERLAEATKSLGELVSAFLALGAGPLEPVAIHVHAARLFAPASTPLSEVDARKMFGELQRVQKHFLRRSPVPVNEAYRQSVLDGLDILDKPAADPFDRLTKLAAQYFKVPIALISLVDRDRQWFLSRCGLEVEQTDRDVAFCAHAIMTDEPLVVLDATQDARFAGNPLVLNEPHVRFYAGAPLISPEGVRLGTFCLIDVRAREAFSGSDERVLKNFAERTVEMIYAQVLDALSRMEPKQGIEARREAGTNSKSAKP